jgi:putative transposase
MRLSFKYRLQPTTEQRQILDRLLETHRRIYNDALKERTLAWKHAGKPVSVSYQMQSNQLKEIRTFDEYAAFANFSSLQQTLRRLQKSYDGFFRRVKAGEEPGHPRFKGRNWFKSICYVYRDGVRFDGQRLTVQRVGSMRMFLHRPLPVDATIKMVVLKRDGQGDWFAVFQIEMPDAEPTTDDLYSVGIDMGLTTFATLSNGEEVANPRWFRQSEKKLAALQKRRARCTRRSRKYKKLSKSVAQLHERTANVRRDFHHKLARTLAGRFNLIFVENLNVKGLHQSIVSKSIGDAGWSQFLFFLHYKAENAGSASVEVNARGTSQTCPACGGSVPKTLDVRVHHCSHCGYVASRDVAAAQVIEIRGLARMEPGRKVFPTSDVASWVARSSPF